MNIIFLDFDGVTHIDGCDEYEEFQYMPFIEKTIKPFLGNWKIVISSNWKNTHELESLKTFFSNDNVKCHVIGVTPKIGNSNNTLINRGKEIEKFIIDNNVKNYIIIDDQWKFLLPKQKKYAVITDSNKGFTNKSRNKFLKIINKVK
jgi:hypothetical protein